jgi:hypothetical protein
MVGIVVKYQSTSMFMRVKGGHHQVGMPIQVVGMLKTQVGQLA